MAKKPPKSIVRTTPFSDLPLAEREAIYQSIDREFTRGETQPLTAADRRELATVRSRRHPVAGGSVKARRPSTGVTVRAIKTTVDMTLLKRADAYAKRHGLKRTQLIAAGLRLAMASGVTADTWDA